MFSSRFSLIRWIGLIGAVLAILLAAGTTAQAQQMRLPTAPTAKQAIAPSNASLEPTRPSNKAKTPPYRPGATVVEREQIYWDQTYSGTVNTDRHERWRFWFSAARDYALTATRTSGDLNPRIVLYDANNQEIARSESGSVTVLKGMLPAGWYYPLVQPAGGGGTYNFVITHGPGTCTSLTAQTQLYWDQSRAGSVDNNVCEYWPFWFSDTRKLKIEVVRTSGNLEPRLVLQTSNGQTLNQADGSGGSATLSDLRATGWYRVLVQAVNGTSGNYTIVIKQILPWPTEPPPTPTPPPSGICEVPFYWQSNPSWGGNKMKTCGKDISHAGCALTSSAMLLKYYGANQNPGTLNACLGNYACLIYWGKVPGCSQGKVTYTGSVGFSWSRLENELKQKRPVILQLNRTGGMHFVLAVSGSGSSASGYLVNDPALKQGQRVKLSAVLARGYNSINSMRFYAGTPPICAVTSANTEQLFSAQPSTEAQAANNRLSMATAITGTADLYWNTEISMTFELAAFSPAGNVTDMLVWTDALSNTIWQPFAQYVEVPLSAQLFVQFRDELGNISEIYSSSSLPEESPGAGQDSLYLPLVIRDLIAP